MVHLESKNVSRVGDLCSTPGATIVTGYTGGRDSHPASAAPPADQRLTLVQRPLDGSTTAAPILYYYIWNIDLSLRGPLSTSRCWGQPTEKPNFQTQYWPKVDLAPKKWCYHCCTPLPYACGQSGPPSKGWPTTPLLVVKWNLFFQLALPPCYWPVWN